MGGAILDATCLHIIFFIKTKWNFVDKPHKLDGFSCQFRMDIWVLVGSLSPD